MGALVQDKLTNKQVATIAVYAVGLGLLWYIVPVWTDEFRGQLNVLLVMNQPAFWGLVGTSIIAVIYLVTVAAQIWNNRVKIGAVASEFWLKFNKLTAFSDDPHGLKSKSDEKNDAR